MVKALSIKNNNLAETELLGYIYDASWTVLKSFQNASLATDNIPPTDSEFVALANFPEGISRVELLLKNFTATNPPAAIVIGLWVSQGTGANKLISFLGNIGYTAGENRASFSNPFEAANRVFIELQQFDPDLKFAIKIFADTSSTTLTPSTETANLLDCVNPGFGTDGSTKVSLFSGGLMPLGLSGYIPGIDSATNVPTITGMSPIVGEDLQLNLNILSSTVLPHWGLSAKVNTVDIDLTNNTLRFVGSAVDFSLLKNRNIRFRAGTGTFPTTGGSFSLSATTTYLIVSCTGSVGDQTVKIANTTDGSTPLIFITYGTGWFYAFPFPYLGTLKLSSGNILSCDGTTVVLKNDWQDAGVTVTTVGTPSTFTHATAHGFSNNQAVLMAGTIPPTGGLSGKIYYVALLTATTYYLSYIAGGIPIAFTSAGTAVTINGLSATCSVGVASIVSPTNPLIPIVNQPVVFGGTTKPGNAYTHGSLFAFAVFTTTFTVTNIKGGAGLAFVTAGNAATMTSNMAITNGYYSIEKKTAYAKGISNKGIKLLVSSGGAEIPITSFGSSNLGCRSVDAATVSGSVMIRGIFE
jgi:hypothetical protein